MRWERNFVWEAMSRGQTISEDDSCNKSTLHSFTIFYGDIAAVNQCLLLSVSLRIIACSASEQRDEGLVVWHERSNSDGLSLLVERTLM